MAKKRIEVKEEVALNDMRTFLEAMKLPNDRVEKYLNEDAVKEYLPSLFQNGTLRLEGETNCLIQTLDDGRELKLHPCRPTMKDLNSIKPPNYDRFDSETKELVPICFLTKIPFRELLENYLISDLEFAKNICIFF